MEDINVSVGTIIHDTLNVRDIIITAIDIIDPDTILVTFNNIDAIHNSEYSITMNLLKYYIRRKYFHIVPRTKPATNKPDRLFNLDDL
jgi:hypothetical protein